MFHIVLVEPEIPPNTGNIIRLCANCGARLHLIEPLGFEFEDRKLRRAGLDYHDLANVSIHGSLDKFLAEHNPVNVYACSTRGTVQYSEINYREGDALIFGPETRGLQQDYLDSLPDNTIIRIPMVRQSRSLNLANAVSIIVYEAWRQNDFAGNNVS